MTKYLQNLQIFNGVSFEACPGLLGCLSSSLIDIAAGKNSHWDLSYHLLIVNYIALSLLSYKIYIKVRELIYIYSSLNLYSNIVAGI